MNSRLTESQLMGNENASTAVVALCPACRRAVLPKGYVAPNWCRDVHRAAADGMLNLDPATEKAVGKAKRRKERAATRAARRSTIRKAMRTGRLVEAAQLAGVKLTLHTNTAPMAEAPMDDCLTCLRIQRAIARRRPSLVA